MVDHLEQLLIGLIAREEDQVLLHDCVHRSQEYRSLNMMYAGYLNLIAVTNVHWSASIRHDEYMSSMLEEFRLIGRSLQVGFIERVRYVRTHLLFTLLPILHLVYIQQRACLLLHINK